MPKLAIETLFFIVLGAIALALVLLFFFPSWGGATHQYDVQSCNSHLLGLCLQCKSYKPDFSEGSVNIDLKACPVEVLKIIDPNLGSACSSDIVCSIDCSKIKDVCKRLGSGPS